MGFQTRKGVKTAEVYLFYNFVINLDYTFEEL
jgi:hypothetical protein